MQQRPRKLQRISKACDFCNRRSIKCGKGDYPLGRCRNCVDFDLPCTFNRPAKRRDTRRSTLTDSQAPKAYPDITSAPVRRTTGSSIARRSLYSALAPRQPVSNGAQSILDFCSPLNDRDDDREEFGMRPSWTAFATSCDQKIQDLVQVYFEIVYPIFPLFHQPSFIEAIKSQNHLRDQGLFASTMAACALVSGRVRDGALCFKRWNRKDLTEPPSEIYFAAAQNAIPDELVAAKGINYMRACALLALTSIQNGKIKDMQKFSGLYHTLTSMDGLYDEKLWPKTLNTIEIEERRRLFWSIYTLDIYSTIVWGGVIRYREAHSLVRYPSELDDELITSHCYGVPSTSLGPSCDNADFSWLRGWNFTTDLYRVLEHIINSNRRRLHPVERDPVSPLFGPTPVCELVVMENVLSMYSALPSRFRETPPITGDMTRDLFGFQSANIHATMQLLRMVLLSTEKAGVDRRCDVAEEMLKVFSKMPIEYLKTINLPLLHHIGGIGSILGSVMEHNLSETSYQRARALVLETADFLDRLEASLHRVSGASECLRCQVARIDGFIEISRQLNLHTVPVPSGNDDLCLGTNPPPAVLAANAHGGSNTAFETSSALEDQISLFQVPLELLVDWPFPLDSTCSEEFPSLAFQ